MFPHPAYLKPLRASTARGTNFEMLLIILPVKNEEKTIEKTARDLYEWCKESVESFQLIFIDDMSEDNTSGVIQGLNNPKITVLRNQFDRGKGSNIKTGFILSNLIYKFKEKDLIAFIDGDGQIRPDNIKTMLNIMQLYQADVVIGNKKHLFSVTKYSWKRMAVSFVYNVMVKILFGIGYDDTQCGIKIFKKEVLGKVIEKINCKRYAFDLELLVAIRELGFIIADCPVVIKPQENKGSASIKNVLETFLDTIIIWFRMQRGYYKK